ncbi:MAG: GTP-binding protein [Bradymonadia bacterium]
MAFINHPAQEINCKIVYYGPGLCGKTTNLHYLHANTNPESKGKMFSLETDTERTLFFDFLPLSFGKIRGFRTRFQLYTVPGQVFYNASRKVILKGVDGIVFVADSDPDRFEANLESLDTLNQNLIAHGYSLEQIPHVTQYNKRDLDAVVEVNFLRQSLNIHGVTDFEASAISGQGVVDTLKSVSKSVLARLSTS